MLLTEKQAAQQLQIDRRTLRKLIDSGRLKAINVGGGTRRHYRVHPDALGEITSPKFPALGAIMPQRIDRPRRSRRAFLSSIESYLPSASS